MLFIANTLLIINIVLATLMCIVLMVSGFKKSTNRVLTLFIFSILIWILANLATNLSSNNDITLVFAKLTLVGGCLIPYFFYLFTKVFLNETFKVKHFIFASILPIVILFLTPTKFNIVSVSAHGFNTVAGPVYYLIIVELILYFGISLRKLNKRRKNKLTTQKQRAQISYIFIGIIISVIPALLANALAPMIGLDQAVFFGPSSFAFLVIFTTLAIVKHELLEIKLIVARTVAYILSIGILALVYGVLAFSIIDGFIFTDTTSTTVKRATFTLLAVILATSYQPLKKYFDKITNKIFYRDAYDSQELLDSLNKVLLSTIELNKLLKNSAEAINKSIRAEFVLFGIKQIEDSPQRILGTSEKQFTKEEIEQVRQITPNLNQKIILVDELDEKDTKLHELLRKNDIAVLVRLTDKPNKKIEGLGYIVLGNKKSGGSYTRQDAQVLEIIGDELVIAIQNALRFEEIQNFAVTLQEKVDDATKKLRKANNRLIELDQTKDDFISMASHQLRTPLTSVKGYISMVMEGDVGKVTKKQNELLDKAFISSQRMVYLIADLLNVSRLRTGKFIIEPKETNLAEVIEGEIAQLKETAKGRDLELVYEKPKSFPTLMLDETKIRQVIMNFADNAIYYTPSGGHIKVSLEDRGDFVEFTVKDDGIGVPKAEQHHLFNKFYRAGNAKKARPDGTGLGLFMAKKVVIAQGGSIIFNTQEGKGSTFGFSFNKNRLLPENYKGV